MFVSFIPSSHCFSPALFQFRPPGFPPPNPLLVICYTADSSDLPKHCSYYIPSMLKPFIGSLERTWWIRRLLSIYSSWSLTASPTSSANLSATATRKPATNCDHSRFHLCHFCCLEHPCPALDLSSIPTCSLRFRSCTVFSRMQELAFSSQLIEIPFP